MKIACCIKCCWDQVGVMVENSMVKRVDERERGEWNEKRQLKMGKNENLTHNVYRIKCAAKAKMYME